MKRKKMVKFMLQKCTSPQFCTHCNSYTSFFYADDFTAVCTCCYKSRNFYYEYVMKSDFKDMFYPITNEDNIKDVIQLALKTFKGKCVKIGEIFELCDCPYPYILYRAKSASGLYAHAYGILVEVEVDDTENSEYREYLELKMVSDFFKSPNRLNNHKPL